MIICTLSFEKKTCKKVYLQKNLSMMYRIKSYAYSYRLEGETEGWNHKGGI